MDRTTALLASLPVGVLVATQAPANAMLGRHVSDLGAAFVSLAFSLGIVTVLLLVAGEPGRLTANLGELTPVHLLGGLAGAAVVVVSLVAVRPLGAGGVTAALVCTQLIGSVVLDRLGLLGLDGVALSPARVAGVVLLLAGTLLVTSSA